LNLNEKRYLFPTSLVVCRAVRYAKALPVVSLLMLFILFSGAVQISAQQTATISDALRVNETVRAANSPAQNDSDGDYSLEKGMNEFGVWGGGGFEANVISALRGDEADDRASFVVGLRYGRTLAVRRSFAFQYTVDVLPLMIETNNVVRESAISPTTRETAYAFGIAPVGLRFIFRPQSRVKPFIAFNAGIAVFNEPFPVPEARRFNFFEEIDGGLLIFNRRRRAVTIGMRVRHISNASTADRNPGLDSFIFYAGYSVFRR
jgi:hypothetical protein